jgi:hypothetical protein
LTPRATGRADCCYFNSTGAAHPTQKACGGYKKEKYYSPFLKHIIGRVRHNQDTAVPFITTAGTFARNEPNSHADISCAGANWSLLQHTGQLCEVNPFQSYYNHVREIPVACCATIWTCDITG